MLQESFSQAALRQAEHISLGNVLAEKRRFVPGVTIDAKVSRDLDDAIWVESNDDGGFTVTVSIADVSSVVDKDSPVDLEAREKATSRYRADGVSPMLPGILSNNLLSLNEGQMRPTVSVIITLDRNLDVTDVTFENTTLINSNRYTYEQATREIADAAHPMHRWGQLAHGLLRKRSNQGALAYYDAETNLYASGESPVQQLSSKTAAAQILVQELMILCNTAVATTMANAGIPFPYRNHRPAEARGSSDEELYEQENVGGDEELSIEALTRAPHIHKRATYDSQPYGHHSLGLPFYTHFTSPIRRYADLIAHRIIKAFIEGRPSPYSQADLDILLPDITERTNAERDEKQQVFLQQGMSRMVELSLSASIGRVLAFSKNEFSTLIKIITHTGEVGDQVAEAIRRRIERRQYTVSDMARIMTLAPQDGGVWDGLRDAVLARLKQRPSDATAMLYACQDIHREKWVHGFRNQQIEGPDGEVLWAMSVEARINGTMYANKYAVLSKSEKYGPQRAAVAFWEQYAAMDLVAPQDTQIPGMQPQPRQEPLPVASRPQEPVAVSIDPAAVTREWNKISGKHGYREQWNYTQEPAAQTPSWQAFLILAREGMDSPVEIRRTGRNKQAAKVDAHHNALTDDRLPHRSAQQVAQTASAPNTTKDPLYHFKQLASKRGWPLQWEYTSEGPPMALRWKAVLTVEVPGLEEPLSFEGMASDKKQAERVASIRALTQLETQPATSFARKEQERQFNSATTQAERK